MDEQRVIAVLDILGFSNLMETMDLDELERLIRGGILTAVEFARQISGEAIRIGDGGDLLPMDTSNGIEYGVVSDTIIVYPASRTKTPLTTLCSTVAILMAILTRTHILLRGAIDFGSFRVIDGQQIYLGKSLIEAYRLEQAQDWAGCILSKRIALQFRKEVASLSESGLIRRHDIPFKAPAPARREHWALNWFHYRLGDDQAQERSLRSLIEDAPQTAQRKLKATVQFFDSVKGDGGAWIEPVRRHVIDERDVTGNYRFARRTPRGD